MNLADVFTVVFVILGLLTIFNGFWLMVAGLFPRQVERCADRLGAAPIKCAALGMACMVPLFVGGVAIGKIGQSAPAKLASFFVSVGTILIALFGVAGLALRIGQGLASPRDEHEPWRRVFRGGVVLAITYGTIVLIPFTLFAGFGAFVLASMRRKAPVTVPVPVVT
jgi:hypothetical protein